MEQPPGGPRSSNPVVERLGDQVVRGRSAGLEAIGLEHPSGTPSRAQLGERLDRGELSSAMLIVGRASTSSGARKRKGKRGRAWTGLLKAYGLRACASPRYLIPSRSIPVLLRVPPAVAKAAMESGVARVPMDDFDGTAAPRTLISRRLELMRRHRPGQACPQAGGLPRGENLKICAPRRSSSTRGSPIPSSSPAARWSRGSSPSSTCRSTRSPSSQRELGAVRALRPPLPRAAPARRRHPWSTRRSGLRLRNYFGTMMVEEGDADGLISGLTQSYPDHHPPALQIIATRPG